MHVTINTRMIFQIIRIDVESWSRIGLDGSRSME